MEGVISDCDKSIQLDPTNKNGYFLRGLARYASGDKARACQDFSSAIALGFTVLKVAEYEKCAEFWE
jgi:hypothetical protein